MFALVVVPLIIGTMLMLVYVVPIKVDRARLPAIYRFSSGRVMQEINVRADGTYINSYYVNRCLRWSYISNWKMEEQSENIGVTFKYFRFGVPGYGVEQPGYWFVSPVTTLFGDRKLCFDPDNSNLCFRASWRKMKPVRLNC